MIADIDCAMWWKQRLKGHRFHDSGEVEGAVRKWLQMQEADFKDSFKLLSISD
jgi:hypothetical protein